MSVAPTVRVGALCLLPVALVLSHRNLVLVLALVALTGLPALVRWRPRPPVWSWPLLGLAAWLALSSAWTPSAADRGWALQLPLFVLTVFGALAAGRTAGAGEARAFGLAVLIACLLLGLEGATGGLIRDLVPPEGAPDRDDVASARGVGLAVSLLPAAALCLVRSQGRAWGSVFAGLAAAALLVGALGFDVAVNALALVAAIGAGLLTLALPRLASLLLFLLAACFVLVPLGLLLLPDAASLETLAEGPLSWRQRLVAWRLIADAWMADGAIFLLGAGQHAAEALGAASGPSGLPDAPAVLPRVPNHPHDVFLQVAYEGGLLGSLLAASGMGLAGQGLRRGAPGRGVAAALAATLAAALAFWAVDASVWTLWRSAAWALAAYGVLAAWRAGKPAARAGTRPVSAA